MLSFSVFVAILSFTHVVPGLFQAKLAALPCLACSACFRANFWATAYELDGSVFVGATRATHAAV
jgi:hypothetical protein